MATAPNPVSFDEYMHTSYSPDCEYIDGAILERNVGKGKHAYTQGKVYLWISQKVGPKSLIVLPEQRVRISATVFVFQTFVWLRDSKKLSAPRLCCALRSFHRTIGGAM